MDGKEINMTLYDLNKAIYQSMSPMKATDFTEQMVQIALWFSSKKDKHFFMLLNKERSDYTIFHISSNYDLARTELTSIITNRGMPMDIDYNHDTDTYDIWIKKEGEVYMYKLFECEDFVIEA